MTEIRRHIIGFSTAALLLSVGQCDPAWGEGASVTIRTVPPTVYTAVQQVRMDVSDESRVGPGVQGDLTWMFNLVFESHEPTELRIKQAKVAFTHDGSPLREETYSREYLEGMEWIRGAYRLTTDYFLDHVMFGGEKPAQPDLPPGGTISWVRIPFSQPSFALADQAEFTFELLDSSGNGKTMVHEVELHTREQFTDLRLPFDGTWLVVKGNHFDSVTHRWTGINGLTTFGWDFVKLGTGHAIYKGDGRAPEDRYSYGARALAAADGLVVHVRNDIPEQNGPPKRAVLERDGDVFAGNLVVIDHGYGEYSLTCHLLPGSVEVQVGEQIEAGQVLGRVGEQGILHFNLMNKAEWLEADGLPAVFTDFERLLPAGEPRAVDQGNPVTGWIVRSTEESSRTASDDAYFPPPGEWARRAPETRGLDAELLSSAIAYAERQKTLSSRDLREVMSERIADEGYGGIIGPMKRRAEFNGLVIRNGFIVAEFGDTARIDMAFSATKSFPAMVAGLAVDRGLIARVNDPVGKYVNDGLFSSRHNSSVTWEHLLHMTSEWEGELWGKPYTVEIPPGHELQEPGSIWIHNDVRVNLLALSLLRLWEEPIPAVLKDHVMDPIGASNEWSWRGYKNSRVSLNGPSVESVSGGGHWGGGLFISARDLGRVGLFLLRKGRWEDRQVLSRQWIEATLTPSGERPTYGYLTWLNTNGELWPDAPHSSFAFRGFGSNVVWVDPEHDLVLVLRWFEWEKLDDIVERLIAAVRID